LNPRRWTPSAPFTSIGRERGGITVYRASVASVLAALMASAILADKPSKPPGQQPLLATCAMEAAFPLPEGHGYVTSQGEAVTVGRAVESYGPADQVLYLHENLLPPDGANDPTGGIALVKVGGISGSLYGPYYGQIRVLDDRLDYFFDTSPGCVQDHAAPNLCPFRLTVVDGTAIYSGKGKTRILSSIAFRGARTLLDYRPCDPAVDPVGCYLNLYGCYDDRDCPDLDPDEDFVLSAFDVTFLR